MVTLNAASSFANIGSNLPNGLENGGRVSVPRGALFTCYDQEDLVKGRHEIEPVCW